MEDIVIAIRTCGRINVIEEQTLRVVKDLGFPIYIFCPECEKKDYLKKYKGIYRITRGSNEGLNIANEMIYKYFPQNKKIIICDDDIKDFWILKEDKLSLATTEELREYIIKGFSRIKEEGYKLFGFYPVKNAYFMKDRPEESKGLAYIQGGLFGVLNDKEVLVVNDDYREDYERSMIHYKRYGGCLRFNHAVVQHIMVDNAGGLNDDRTKEKMEKSTNFMLETYPDLCFEKKSKSKYREIQLKQKPYCIKNHLQKQLNLITWSKNTDRPNVSGIDEEKTKNRKNQVGLPCYSYTFGYIRPRRAKKGTLELTRITNKYPLIYRLASEFGGSVVPKNQEEGSAVPNNQFFTTITINKDIVCEPHTDKYNNGDSLIVSIGDYTEGGNLYIEDKKGNITKHDTRTPLFFNGAKFKHWNDKANSQRFSFVYFRLD